MLHSVFQADMIGWSIYPYEPVGVNRFESVYTRLPPLWSAKKKLKGIHSPLCGQIRSKGSQV